MVIPFMVLVPEIDCANADTLSQVGFLAKEAEFMRNLLTRALPEMEKAGMPKQQVEWVRRQFWNDDLALLVYMRGVVSGVAR